MSCKIVASNYKFDIDPGDAPKHPVLRRLKSADIQHEVYWNFSTGRMANEATDLVSPNVFFIIRSSILNGSTTRTRLIGPKTFSFPTYKLKYNYNWLLFS